MLRHRNLTLVLSAALALPGLARAGFAQDSSQNKNLDIRSSVGDLHVGNDADARKAGLPLYPGARLKSGDDHNQDQANLSLLTDAFGMKLVVANYESDDAAAKIVDFYRDKLKKYGKVLECHTHKHGGNVEMHDGDMDSDENKNDNKNDNRNDGKKDKELKCDDNSGPVTELKVGTDDDQHVVAVEPRDKGSKFALVYVRTRGKRGEI